MTTARVLIRFSALGDIVLSSALVARLGRLYPRDLLYFVTQPDCFSLLTETFPVSVEPIGVSTSSKNPLRYFWLGWSFLKKISPETESLVVYDLHGVLKSTLFVTGLHLAKLFQNPKLNLEVRKSRKEFWGRWMSVWAHRDLLGPRNVFREHLALEPNGSMDVPKLKTDPNLVRGPHSVLIAPDAKHWKKRWPVTYWATFMHQILSQNQSLKITLVGGPQSLPMDFLNDLQMSFGSRVENLLGKTELNELPNIAARHQVTVCGNSSWLHISEAVGTPVVSLAGPIVPGFGFSPWKPESVELSVALDCRPCSRHGGGLCTQKGEKFHACMKDISPSEVYAKVSQFVGGTLK
jgi:ADP-heptose:LPS heptosyltransferase